jgi:hypothetical protein
MKNLNLFGPINSLIFMVALVGLIGVSCSTKSSELPQSTKVRQQPVDWDHKTIRQKREAERAQSAKDGLNDSSQQSSNQTSCLKVSKAEMEKSPNLTGCRPLDPREGHGQNMFCCDDTE